MLQVSHVKVIFFSPDGNRALCNSVNAIFKLFKELKMFSTENFTAENVKREFFFVKTI